MAVDRVIDRSVLRFAEKVKMHFAFLETLGFRCVRSDATFVRYESSLIAIDISHGRQSYEIGLHIEALEVPAQSYSMSELLHLVDPKRAANYQNHAARTVESVSKGVHGLAIVFQASIDLGVLKDKDLFSRLKLQRSDLAKKYALEVQLKQARRKCQSAWIEKDFDKIVDTLSPLQEHLDPLDLKKLVYAKKHLGTA